MSEPRDTGEFVRWRVTWRPSPPDPLLWLVVAAGLFGIAVAIAHGYWAAMGSFFGLGLGFLLTLHAFLTGHFVVSEAKDSARKDGEGFPCPSCGHLLSAYDWCPSCLAHQPPLSGSREGADEPCGVEGCRICPAVFGSEAKHSGRSGGES